MRVKKSRVTYVILGLAFGLFGVHNFYANRLASGIIQLILTMFVLLLSWLIIPLFLYIPLYLWVLIELIVVRHSAYGTFTEEL